MHQYFLIFNLVLIIFAYKTIGLASLAPVFVVIFLIFPLQFLLSVKSSSTAVNLTNLITKRVHWMSEILTAIKLIKLFTWERFYQEKLTEMRENEMKMMRTELRYKIASFMLAFATPALSVALAIFLANDPAKLTPIVVFSLLFLFNTLRYPLNVMQNGERSINGAIAAMKKLESFLLLPEIDNLLEASEMPDGVSMQITKADFVWDGDLDHPHVYELDLELKRGQVIAVVGDIGSAKSLLAAIMGQIKRTAGEVKTDGSKFGYVPQEPWFINASIRDNIDFGLEHDEKRYAEAIRISGLTRDIMLLSNGDQSYITDLSLSISQKHRLALARCIYHNPGIILMENFLEDFSTAHAKQLFKESIRNQLSKNACVVIATQQKQFLPECDMIIVMKAGRIVERGTYLQLKSRNVNFSPWVTDVISMDDDPNLLIDAMTEIQLDSVLSTTAGIQVSSVKPPSGSLLHMSMNQRKKPRSSPLALSDPITPDEQNRQNLMVRKEISEHTISKIIERSQGSILSNATRPPTNFANQDILTRTIEANTLTIHSIKEFDVGTMDPDFGTKPERNPYWLFLRDSPGLAVGIFLLISSTSHVFRLLSDIFFSLLVDPMQNEQQSKNLMLAAIFSGCVALSILFRGFGFLNLVLVQGEKWHKLILNAVLMAPMSFYEITPLGHILSFFAKHLYSVDEVLPDAMLQVVSFAPLVVGALIISCVFVPWLWATLPLILIVWAVICKGCLKAMDTFAQLECMYILMIANNKSPMFAHLSNTLEGLFHIRLYKAQEKFDHYNRNLIDGDHKALYSLLLVKALLSASLDVVSSLFVLITAIFCVVFKVSAANTGLAVTNAMQLLLFLPWLIRMTYVLHGSMSSISSLTHFAENVPKEVF